MPKRKLPLKGTLPEILNTPIYLRDAKASWLRGAFGLEPTEEDYDKYTSDELMARLDALVEHYDLDWSDPNLMEKLAKRLVEDEWGISHDDPNWWVAFAALVLLGKLIPGFTVKPAHVRKPGAPTKWGLVELGSLVNDFETEKAKHPNLNQLQICKIICRDYASKWGTYPPGALCKALIRARKLIPSREMRTTGPSPAT